ncbi:DUF5324 family protein [Kitasatospora sp. NBC_00085]|uniref:DUF5324 family protein n=1 Tax=unclassified Kitasatospora TaxID=2633591 RepID=UPI0032509984
MTRLDSARETAGKTRDTLAPYAATAKETAVNLADGAKQRLGPALDSIGPKAAHAAHHARVQYDKRIASQLGHAFASLPPEAQQNALKALHRAQEAALAARLSAAHARTTVGPRVAHVVDGARATVVPVAQEAHTRGAAALTALHGHVTSAEISDLAARNLKKEHRNGWATGLAVAGAVAIGSGIVAWQWWRHHSNPEWLVEPPATGSAAAPQHSGGAHAAGSAGSNAAGGADTLVNGSTAGPASGGTSDAATAPDEAEAGTGAPKPGPTPGKPGPGDDHPKPHDPRKPH